MDDNQLLRYSRQILLPQVGITGQERLQQSKVLIIGMGGLGSPAAMYLAAAGIGQLYICDFDTVELSNLQRQIIHNTADIGRLKVESAKTKLQALNPLIQITSIAHQLTEHALLEIVQQMDVVLDCTDNLTTRFAINAACVNAHKPLVSGAAIRLEGQIAVFHTDKNSPCYRCLFNHEIEPIETCSQTGVIAPLLGILGSMQALEAMKLLMNIGEPLIGQMLLFDAMSAESCYVKLIKNPHCPHCGQLS
ncbi:HesA/MoeB/ThiF family protein [Beggiatoa leptomitoformis]|uniref:Molybdopterin-synthase adenylyltransferase n=1 Tax=Beggiatoa leptomitoformis TaxID=288004 RepID=A0A2N9YHW2_9GAMM|nr:molybdopterin-synthase adenylyltransferase MoeB [Beggiatoa leptomitoformis]ALG67674.1 molybdopterin-synthase adenylyltransferase MoeB [Beggiatoa leptomitoformis]AUI70090.1 molybdopterin-synthase adenylyltransferase MoeB [Beggiatoa leptomitoformis]